MTIKPIDAVRVWNLNLDLSRRQTCNIVTCSARSQMMSPKVNQPVHRSRLRFRGISIRSVQKQMTTRLADIRNKTAESSDNTRVFRRGPAHGAGEDPPVALGLAARQRHRCSVNSGSRHHFADLLQTRNKTWSARSLSDRTARKGRIKCFLLHGTGLSVRLQHALAAGSRRSSAATHRIVSRKVAK